MKTIGYLVIAVALTVFILSCKKSFLDVPITREVVAEEYVNNLATAEEYLNGIFLMVARDIAAADNFLYADLTADNLKVTGSNHVAAYQYSQDGAEGVNNRNLFWMSSYHLIRSCNFLLEHIDQYRQENPAKSDAIKGQAYAIRALVHDNLVKVFAQSMKFSVGGTHMGIPYDTVFSQSQALTRQPVTDVYNNIVLDLQRAISLIPATLNGIMPAGYTPQTWISQQAAIALLARACLFKGDFALARHAAVTVISQAALMPSADYPTKLYTANDNESLFWSPPLSPTNGGSSTVFQGNWYRLDLGYSATTDLVNLIQERPNDKRNQWFTLYTSGRWQIKKFPQSAIAGYPSAGNAYYQTFIRTSEMYLTAAECYAQTGDEDSARYYLDTIRKRADLTATTTVATGPALLDSIYKERRKELCFENLRMYDLQRLGEAVVRQDVETPAPSELPFPSNKAIAPIPPSDAAILFPQNPGYE